MEYLYHYVLVYVPAISICLLAIAPLPLALTGWLAKCYRHTDRDNDAESMRNEIVKIVLGDQYLKHIKPKDTNSCDPEEQRRMLRGHHKYSCFGFFLAAAVLCLIVVVWWILLVEQVTVGKCVTGADCFVTKRYKTVDFYPDRVINCSNYNHTDSTEMLICYKAGFYFFEACSKAGGVLAIVSTTVKIYIPAIIACAKGRKKCYYIAGLITGCVGVFSFIAVILLMFLLPPDSDYLSLVMGTASLQLFPIFISVVLMSVITCTMPWPKSQYHPDYEELPES